MLFVDARSTLLKLRLEERACIDSPANVPGTNVSAPVDFVASATSSALLIALPTASPTNGTSPTPAADTLLQLGSR
jgi:hypothetical protein